MKKIVGVDTPKKEIITKELICSLRDQALNNIRAIKEVPSVQELYKAVDDLWEKGNTKQLIFQNKDQHYAYVTEIYNTQIKGKSLDEYKKLLTAQTMARFDSLLGMIDNSKMKRAYDLAKEHRENVLKNMQSQIDDLKERNEKVNKEIMEDITKW